ncbi:MAG: hypothetical protein IPG42_20315 [Betaproteobacteria bacterium]|nr:hypothetical protein [Betaproteobacteria bacterium]
MALTGPYLHDGTAPTLEETVRHHGALSVGPGDQSGRGGATGGILKTLTGEYQGRVLQ